MKTCGALLIACLTAVPVSAQPSQLTNAQVHVVPAAGNLARAVDEEVARISGVGWVAYAVPLLPGDRFLCDWTNGAERRPTTAVKLEGPDTLFVFFRVEDWALTRVRMFSDGCAIDAGGLPVAWIDGAAAGSSVTLLSRLVDPARSRRIVDGALAALAMHADPAAAAALVTAARSGPSAQARGQALFWVAQRAGSQALPTIADAVERDPDTDVKKRAVFALSQLPENEGVPKLIEVASSHSNPAVRRQAMFWLGQSKDPRALAFFEKILLSR